MEIERCENCKAYTNEIISDPLFKRCAYCGKALAINKNNFENEMFLENMYYDEIITGHRLFIGFNLKSDYELMQLTKDEINYRVEKLITDLFNHFKEIQNFKEKKDIIKAINNIYDTFY